MLVVLVTLQKWRRSNQKCRRYSVHNNFSDVQGQITLELVVVSGRNLNSFKLSCMSLLPARMRLIQLKMKELECSQDSSIISLWGFFQTLKWQFTPQSLVRSDQISNSVRDVMVVLVTCKNEEDPIKNVGARVFTTIFSDVQGQITLELVVVSGWNLNSFKLSCMSSLPARMRLIQSKNEGARVFTRFFHYKSMGIFTRRSRAVNSAVLGPIWPNFEPVRDVMESEMLWMSSLPASMKKIQSKMKELECSQDFSHYNPMGAISCHGNQSSNPIWPKT